MNDANNAGTLAPCPFCGGKPTLINGGPGNCYVRCTKCKASSNDVSRDLATELWNTRILSTPNAPVELAGVVAELRDLAAEQTLKCWEPRHGDWMRALKKSAEALESQAKALSEAEAESKRNAEGFAFHAGRAERERARALAAEARLAEAMKVIEPFAKAADDLDDTDKDAGHIWEAPCAMEITVGMLGAARAFTNAAKEKTDAS